MPPRRVGIRGSSHSATARSTSRSRYSSIGRCFPWIERLEAEWTVIRDELAALLAEHEDRLVPYFKADQVSHPGRWLVDRAELRRALGEAGRRWAKSFSWDATARKLFEDLV